MHKAHRNKETTGLTKWVTLYVSTPRVQDLPTPEDGRKH